MVLVKIHPYSYKKKLTTLYTLFCLSITYFCTHILYYYKEKKDVYQS